MVVTLYRNNMIVNIHVSREQLGASIPCMPLIIEVSSDYPHTEGTISQDL